MNGGTRCARQIFFLAVSLPAPPPKHYITACQLQGAISLVVSHYYYGCAILSRCQLQIWLKTILSWFWELPISCHCLQILTHITKLTLLNVSNRLGHLFFTFISYRGCDLIISQTSVSKNVIWNAIILLDYWFQLLTMLHLQARRKQNGPSLTSLLAVDFTLCCNLGLFYAQLELFVLILELWNTNNLPHGNHPIHPV